MFPHLKTIQIDGYRAFRDFTARCEPLEVIVGSNGSGKSCLFEFLRFLRDSLDQEIPSEIVSGSIGQQVFHVPGVEMFSWDLEIDLQEPLLHYTGELSGPVGMPHVTDEHVGATNGVAYMYRLTPRSGIVYREDNNAEQPFDTLPQRLALGMMQNWPAFFTLHLLANYMQQWRFYGSLQISKDKVTRSVPVEQEPELREDAGNLSSVLHYLLTEHRDIFLELEEYLRLCVPGFQNLTVKARGGKGEVMAFWREKGMDEDLSLADLSDGTLRLLCWIVLCVHPNPPTLICIDEPDQGVHPRTLSILAGLFEKASQRTQIFLATHSSYFLSQFQTSQIAVMKKENGAAKFLKPKDSKALMSNLEEFGNSEIEALHRSDELEALS